MRALIISVDLGDPDFTAHAEEFAMLAKGAGAEIVGTLTARRDRPDAKFFIGSGKADEGVGMAQALLAEEQAAAARAAAEQAAAEEAARQAQNNNNGYNSDCWLVLILLFCCGGWNNNGCGCGNSNNCGCGC